MKPCRRASAPQYIGSIDKENEKGNESPGGLLAAEQEAKRCRKDRRQIREEARQFINSMAALEGESECDDVESDNESNVSEDSFIVEDDVFE